MHAIAITRVVVRSFIYMSGYAVGYAIGFTKTILNK